MLKNIVLFTIIKEILKMNIKRIIMKILEEFMRIIMGFSYNITQNYLYAIILFTFITKILLFPINIIVQKNGIKMVRMMPELNRIKYDNYGEKDIINEKTLKLYKKEGYHPIVSVIPMIIQLILLMVVIEVIKKPDLLGLTSRDMVIFGIDFLKIPAKIKGKYLIIPIVAAFSALVLCIVQDREQVLQEQQGKINKYGLTIFSTSLSLILGLYVTAGVAVYWIFGNIFGTLQVYILNFLINPKKYINYDELEETKKQLLSLQNTSKKLSKAEKKRQKRDYKRFFKIDNKHIVFYSESNGFYKYYKGLIEWLISNSNIKIHYITSDPNDNIFELAKSNSQIVPYFIGEIKLISLFLKMDAKIVVMTMPDLDKYHIKRSYVKKNIEYIYIDHGFSSLNLLLRKGAVDNFDTIFCAGEHICDEMRAQEKCYNLKEKNLVKYGYGLIEELVKSYEKYNDEEKSEEKFVLLAPSHQRDNILDSCLENVVNGLKDYFKVIIRPHPQYVRRYPEKWKKIVEKYMDNDKVIIQEDFSSNDTIYKATFVVTDWSNIGYEFSFSTLKPVMFVNTPMKIINPDYKEIGVEPIDIWIRSKLGIEVSGNDVEEIKDACEKLLSGQCISSEQIKKIREETLYNFMKCNEVAGKYILGRLIKKN